MQAPRQAPGIDQIARPRFELEVRDQKGEATRRPTLSPSASMKAAQNSLKHRDLNDECAAMNAASACSTLNTRRFRFRPLVTADLERLAVLARDRYIAPTTVGVAYPYTIEFARLWMSKHSSELDSLRLLHWAVGY